MTCNQMLERLIEADPEALAGQGGSDVAKHVRECVRCRAVAEQLLAETRILSTVVGHGGAVIRRLRPTPIVLALAAAAAMAFMMLPDQPSSSPITIVPSRAPVVAVTPAAITPVVVSPALPPVVRSPTPSAVASASAPGRQVARAYPPATPVTVSPMQLTTAEVSYQQVAVTPPPGKRVAVMRTDPAITVIWVY